MGVELGPASDRERAPKGTVLLPSAGWGRPRRVVWPVAAVSLVAFTLLFGTVGGGADWSRQASAAVTQVVTDAIGSWGLVTLAAAEHSLASGAGPAGGTPLSCTLSGVTLSGQCHSTVAVPTTPSPNSRTAGACLSPRTVATVSTSSIQPGCSAPPLSWQSSNQPEARTQMGLAYDVQDGYVVAFGGWTGTTYLGDTWEYLHGKWIALNPPIAPAPRAGAAMTYDKKDGYVVLFGGHNAGRNFGDTWTFAANRWTQLSPTAAPSPRTDAAIVYDLRDGYTVLFGGWNGAQTLSDTWKFQGGLWTLLEPVPTGGKVTGGVPVSGGNPSQSQNQSPIPLGREDAAITFDTRDSVVVMFGGLNISQGGERFLNDTWEFSGTTWTSLTLADAPPARSGAVFAYDPKDNASVLFGGMSSSAPLQFDDTWTLVGGVWNHIGMAKGPAARAGAAGIWDVADNYFVLFSGNEEGLPASVPDTWTYVHGNWTVDTSSQQYSWPNPAARYAASMAYDAADGVAVLFGGTTGLGTNGETWLFANQDWTQIFPSPTPPARSFASLAYDASDQYLVLFGGRSATGAALGDTWTFHQDVWSQLTLTTAPAARYGASMVYDSPDGEVVLYGGVTTTGADLGDTWTFVAGHWSELAPTVTPGLRGFAEASYDARDGYAVLYGGLRGTSILGDTWEFRGGTWTNLTSQQPNGTPPARWGAVFEFDPANNITLLFGGCEQSIDPVRMECNRIVEDSWRFSEGLWGPITTLQGYGVPQPLVEAYQSTFNLTGNSSFVLIQSGFVNGSGQPLTNMRWVYSGQYTPWFPPVGPSPREGAASQYETTDDKIVAFGGYGPLPGGGLGYLNDTWEWDTYVWYPVAHTTRSPSARAFGALAYDAAGHEVIYFGGYGATGYLNDTWAFLGGPATGNWHPISTPTAPSPRANESMAYDAADQYIVLFGGQDGTTALGDTWTFSGNHLQAGSFWGNWTPIHPAVSPPARAAASMIYDSYERYIVLFGGYVPSTSVAFGDTWKFVGGTWSLIPTAVAPSPRFGATFVDDPQDVTPANTTTVPASAMLFGGETASGSFLGDTWTFYAGTWTLDTTAGTPPASAGAFAMVGNDVADGSVEMFGGTNGYPMGGFWTFY